MQSLETKISRPRPKSFETETPKNGLETKSRDSITDLHLAVYPPSVCECSQRSRAQLTHPTSDDDIVKDQHKGLQSVFFPAYHLLAARHRSPKLV